MSDLRQMNAAQRNAVTHKGGPLLVLAGPGSGKTFTVSRRILYLIKEQGVPPEQILVLTFTREAAASLERRFRELSDGFSPVNFGTFHSVFFHILRQSDAVRSKDILTNSQKIDFLIPILKKYGEAAGRQQSRDNLREDAVLFLSAVSYYKNTLREESAAKRLPAELRGDFGRLLREYEAAVRSRGLLDFDDMLIRCRQLLTKEEAFRQKWQQRFRHILIDEFQDINPVQYEVIKLLAGTRSDIFAVGDDDQAIYGFRGSEPECLKRFQTEYGAKTLLLDVNYRSHWQIVQASLAVIGENKNRFVKRLRAERQGGDPDVCRVRLRPFSDREAQYDYLTERLAGFSAGASDTPDNTCAVLFRTNSRMQGLAVRLKSAGIPFVMNEKMQSIYEHFIVRDVMAYLRLAAGEPSRELLLRAVNRPSRYVSREAVENCGNTVEGLLAYYEDLDLPHGIRQSVLAALESFDRQLKALSRLSPALAVSYVRKAAGYEKYLRTLAGGDADKRREWEDLLEWLQEDAKRFPDVRQWLAAQEEHTKSLENGGGREKKGAYTAGENVPIRLMTVHGAKGLEFDTVIIPDCNEGVFPHGRLLDAAELEEERRVFYVAMTRAKESLELLFLTGTRERPRQPSGFIRPLADHSSTSSSNSQLSRYSSKASATFSYSSSSSM